MRTTHWPAAGKTIMPSHQNQASSVYVTGVGGVGALYPMAHIAAGRSHSLAVGENGRVYAWGRNDAGQLGDGTLTSSSTPVPVLGPDGITPLGGVVTVYASPGSDVIGGGGGFSIAVKADGSVWAWGDNSEGQLGDGTTTRRPFLVRVGGPSFGSVKAISAGMSHVVLSKTDGTVWTWGRNDLGQLGRTSAEICETSVPCSTSPGQVENVSNIAGVFTRFAHTIVTTSASAVARYSYDGLDRLTSDGRTLFAYDPVGNRTSKTVAGTTSSYAYDRADRVTTFPYVVDAAGNMTRRPTRRPEFNNEPDQLTYDQANRLSYYYIPFTANQSYLYNGDGLLTNIITSPNIAGPFSYLYDVNGLFPVVLVDTYGDKYVWGLGLVYSANQYSGAIRVMHADALTSVKSLTDQNGNVVQTYQRDSFGGRISTSGTSTQPFDFTGEVRDYHTGLVYLRSRMYDPEIGRFISRDSFGGSAAQSQSQNRYSYVANNPATLRDPSGKCPFCLLPVAMWLGVELGLFGFDTIDTAQTLSDPSVTDEDKAATVAGYTAGALLPGGAFGFVSRTGAQAFRSFSSFKRTMGPAGVDMHWHHIVGQTDGNVARFGAEAVHNTDNVITINADVHHRISGYYNSIRDFTGGRRVHEWLADQPYEFQRQFGLDTVRRFLADTQ